jgi:hypothetical protein
VYSATPKALPSNGTTPTLEQLRNKKEAEKERREKKYLGLGGGAKRNTRQEAHCPQDYLIPVAHPCFLSFLFLLSFFFFPPVLLHSQLVMVAVVAW